MTRCFAMLLVLLLSTPAMGQAYCAMRDPVTGIFATFPEAERYTRTIRPQLRRVIGERLPFTLHFNELGRHTMYLAMADEQPMGLLHVRSERGRYGLIEVGWGLDLGMHVHDVYLQRCRDDKIKAALAAIKTRLKGASLNELIPMWEKATDSAEKLLLESAIKTIVVTKEAWGDALLPWQAAAVAEATFGPGAVLEQVALDTSTVEASFPVQLKFAAAWQVQDAAGEDSGWLVRMDMTPVTHPLDLWWVVDEQRRMKALVRSSGKADEWCVMMFDLLGGKGTDELKDCATAVGVVAAQIIEGLPTEQTHTP